MDATETRQVMDFEKSLAIGSQVEVRWTNSGNYYSSTAEVSKLNEKSVRVKIQRSIERDGKVIYPLFHEITVPRFTLTTLDRWSGNNGVFECPGP